LKTKDYCNTSFYNKSLFSQSNKNASHRLKKQEIKELMDKVLKKVNLIDDMPVYTIPIAFHVVYNKPVENIERQQILSQIEAINKDFRNYNINQIPTKFDRERKLATDSKITFCIANKDANGNSIEGITRTCTQIESFTPFSDSGSTPIELQLVKATRLGGKDGWPSDKNLNVWICNLKCGPGGYAQYPIRSPLESQYLTDGIVIDYRSFGLGGTAEEPYNSGRTLTHEIGHWLGLLHLWGNSDDNLECLDDDEIDDTPKQSGPQRGCPENYENTAICEVEYPLLMNFMDYFNDECSLMFTKQQVLSMRLNLEVLRSTFVN